MIGKDGGQFIDLGNETGQAFYIVEKVSDIRFKLHRMKDGQKSWAKEYSFPIADSVTSLPIPR